MENWLPLHTLSEQARRCPIKCPLSIFVTNFKSQRVGTCGATHTHTHTRAERRQLERGVARAFFLSQHWLTDGGDIGGGSAESWGGWAGFGVSAQDGRFPHMAIPDHHDLGLRHLPRLRDARRTHHVSLLARSGLNRNLPRPGPSPSPRRQRRAHPSCYSPSRRQAVAAIGPALPLSPIRPWDWEARPRPFLFL